VIPLITADEAMETYNQVRFTNCCEDYAEMTEINLTRITVKLCFALNARNELSAYLESVCSKSKWSLFRRTPALVKKVERAVVFFNAQIDYLGKCFEKDMSWLCGRAFVSPDNFQGLAQSHGLFRNPLYRTALAEALEHQSPLSELLNQANFHELRVYLKLFE
jgi:hypothetical protein